MNSCDEIKDIKNNNDKEILEKEFFEEIINYILNEDKFTRIKLNNSKIKLSKKYNLKRIVKNPEIIAHCPNEKRPKLVSKLNIKPIRESSGVTVVALFAKPHACPHGKCIYCPGGVGSVFGDTPQSYTGKEPAAMRAIRNHYDPYLQIFNRLEHYIANGHTPDKLELIYMGGTFPSLDKEYREEFVNFTYKAINDFGEKFLFFDKDNKRQINYDEFNKFFITKGDFNSQIRENEIQAKILKLKNENLKDYDFEINKNETSIIRSIGLTVETKPDWALEKHCKEMLKYGCTRLEIGVQTLNEECLKKTNRGHSLKETKDSFQIAKDLCLKINAHMMLGLPASNLEIDEESLTDLFEKEDFRPDMLKIYPCLVNRGTPLFSMWKKDLFKPIGTKVASQIIARSYAKFPRYVRVMRVQRDIPTTIIEDGVSNSNLRQFVDIEMKRIGVESKDIREREIGLRQIRGFKTGKFKINIEKYNSSKGIDYFLDVVDENDTMIGFIRLRFPFQKNLTKEITEKTALIRELHIYGEVAQVGEQTKSKSQHKGWGRKLLKKAEEIAIENGFEKMIIISGVGVREYYRKFDYKLEGTYMSKKLN